MSDYYPSPDELRDAWINDYDAGMPPDISECSSTSVEANTLEGQMSAEDERATCEWFDGLPKPPEPLPWIEAPKATDKHPFE